MAISDGSDIEWNLDSYIQKPPETGRDVTYDIKPVVEVADERKGARHMLSSFFEPLLPAGEESLWHSSPCKQQETESLASSGPVHSTPLVHKPSYMLVSPLRRSPRNKQLVLSQQLRQRQQPTNVLHTKSYMPKQLPAKGILHGKRSLSPNVDILPAKRLLKTKADVCKSFNFDFVGGQKNRKTPSQKIVQSRKNCSNFSGSSQPERNELQPVKNTVDRTNAVASSKKQSALLNNKIKLKSVPKSQAVSITHSKVDKQFATDPIMESGLSSNLRLSLTMMKVSKKGCLCHEHTADSPCPLASTPKKIRTSPDTMQSTRKSPRKNLTRLMLQTIGKTRKNKHHEIESCTRMKRTPRIEEYDFSSGLDSFG